MAKPTDPLALWAELLAERPDLAPADDAGSTLVRGKYEWGFRSHGDGLSTSCRDDDALAHLRAHAAMKVAEANLDYIVKKHGEWFVVEAYDHGDIITTCDSYDAALIAALKAACPKEKANG